MHGWCDSDKTNNTLDTGLVPYAVAAAAIYVLRGIAAFSIDTPKLEAAQE